MLLNASDNHGAAPRRTVPPAARALGWFSVGLGLLELTAPGAVARATGLRGRESLIRLYGLREVASGIGILTSRDPQPWIRARIAGDAMDLATLAAHMHDGNRHAARTAAAMVAVAGVTAADVLVADAMGVHRSQPVIDYSARRGVPGPLEDMRGLAMQDFEVPADMRTPELLRPYPLARPASATPVSTE